MVLHVPDPVDRADAGRGDAGRADAGRGAGERLRAWRPAVPGVAEALQARFVRHAYPAHTHQVWTLLVVDAGAIRFDLERREHGAVPARVTLLPPHVAHTGRAGTAAGFAKRVVYLEPSVLGEELTPAAVGSPDLVDPLLRRRVGQLHAALAAQGEELEAESRLALVAERLREHLGQERAVPTPPSRGLAADLRDLLDAHLAEALTLRDAGRLLHAHPDHLVRAFTAAFALPPHRYVIGRRVEAARRRLLAGEAPAAVAVATGFHDQAHLTRHFARTLGTTPARYAASAGITSYGPASSTGAQPAIAPRAPAPSAGSSPTSGGPPPGSSSAPCAPTRSGTGRP